MVGMMGRIGRIGAPWLLALAVAGCQSGPPPARSGPTWGRPQPVGTPSRSRAERLSFSPLDQGSNPTAEDYALLNVVAPPFELRALDGPAVSLDQLQADGQTAVVLDFWATWSEPCRQARPAFERLRAAYGSRLAVVGVTVGEEAAVRRMVAQLGLREPQLLDDGTVAAAYGAEHLPLTIFINPREKIVAVREAAAGPPSLADLKAGAEQALAQPQHHAVAPPSSQK